MNKIKQLAKKVSCFLHYFIKKGNNKKRKLFQYKAVSFVRNPLSFAITYSN